MGNHRELPIATNSSLQMLKNLSCVQVLHVNWHREGSQMNSLHKSLSNHYQDESFNATSKQNTQKPEPHKGPGHGNVRTRTYLNTKRELVM